MYEAASRAYADAGVDPRSDVGSFLTCAEDYWEGFGIFDEFTPDQLGAVLRPACTIPGDGIQGMAQGFLQIQAGLAEVVAVEAHSKISDLLTYDGVVRHALDPIWNKPLGGHPYYVAGLEMGAYLRASKVSEKECAAIVAKNRQNAMTNERAAYGARIDAQDVLASEPVATPLKELDVAPLADTAVVLVLAAESRAKKLQSNPVWIRGVGWSSDSPWLETREWAAARYAQDAAAMAYKMAKIRNPRQEIRVAEVDDKFSYKEPQHLEALGLVKKGQTAKAVNRGDFAIGGKLPVNPSGGSLGCGNVIEASGLHRVAEVALQLRGEAGRNQADSPAVGLAASWRGIPTATGAVAVLGVGR
ncbi:MAG TPA: acetyl-CoA acetyltransferase [Thermoplasmata archaeon]|jgi:acetyl-CoA C-acetyltransferase|nr:acetyl-CoA acetyltransferase [Thermoplasmata archaeon]